MSVVTMTTDWGLRDPHVATFKGLMLRRQPGIQVIDITHLLQPHDRLGAAYVIRNACPAFPDGTIHYIGLNTLEGGRSEKGSDYLIVEVERQFYIGADCGIFSMILEDRPYRSWKLPLKEESTLEELQLFMVESILQLARGNAPDRIGETHNSLLEAKFSSATGDSSGLRGTVIYIDQFGNAVYNITRQQFESAAGDRSYTLLLRKAKYGIKTISTRYDNSPDRDLLAMFNQDGMLEVAINRGNAAQLLGIRLFDPILIEFHDQADSKDEIPAGERSGVSGTF